MISYGWLVGFCCRFFLFCPCQCSVADKFHFFSVFVLSFTITASCFSNVCAATVVARNLVHALTCLNNCTQDQLTTVIRNGYRNGLADFLVSCRVSRLCLFRIFVISYFGHVFISNITWPHAWWSSPLVNKTSQLGIDFAFWLCNMNVVSIVNPT